jgi:hypothetical protein
LSPRNHPNSSLSRCTPSDLLCMSRCASFCSWRSVADALSRRAMLSTSSTWRFDSRKFMSFDRCPFAFSLTTVWSICAGSEPPPNLLASPVDTNLSDVEPAEADSADTDCWRQLVQFRGRAASMRSLSWLARNGGQVVSSGKRERTKSLPQ